ncbi:sensor histidine kinase [Actinoplanes sp. RD1]|uniref:sensor histidine kinase n=1 Tax=Actinoplanes sp. RD1 TaxID=3064538 RepID=UPI0027410563|nr:histidine kinase [Actinoplanes sp. RD1]
MNAGEGIRRQRQARTVTLVALAANAVMALFLPAVGLWREPDARLVVMGAVGVTLFALAQGAVLHVLVTPWTGPGTRRRAYVALAAASVLSVALVGPVGDGWPTWAWLACCIVGIVPLLVRWPLATAMCALTVVVTVAVALAAGDDPLHAVLIVVTVGAGVAALNAFPVWFWNLLVQAEYGRAAQAQLAASEERLRFARDVHDLLGHRLSVIALKAELAERLAPVDADRAADEAAEVRRMVAAALAEVREVVHGYRQIDLRAELRSIEHVLRSSGVRCTVTAPDADLPEAVAAPLAAVLREAVTNVLRHSQATSCAISICRTAGTGGDAVIMTVVNDGVTDVRPDRHSHGLRGLAERLAETGGTLRTHAADGRFTVEAVVSSTP